MFDLSMDEELEDFYRDRDRFKKLKHLIDFDFEKDYETKAFDVPAPKYKKKLTASKFIKPNNKDKSLF